MSDSRVTKVTLGANNYKVRLSGLKEGYYSQEEQYDIFAIEPQLTICLGAAMLSGTASGNYAVGSVIYDYSIDYYVNPDAEKQTTINKQLIRLNHPTKIPTQSQ